MSVRIPEPEYFYDLVNGAVYEHADGAILVIGEVPAAAKPIIAGEIVLRYGIVTLLPPGEVIIPGLFAAEKGGFLVGREAWNYLQRHFQTHPRADVVGIQLDGKQVQKLVKELDFGVPVRVYAYSSVEDAQPVAALKAVKHNPVQVELPELLSQYLETL